MEWTLKFAADIYLFVHFIFVIVGATPLASIGWAQCGMKRTGQSGDGPAVERKSPFRSGAFLKEPSRIAQDTTVVAAGSGQTLRARRGSTTSVSTVSRRNIYFPNRFIPNQ